MPLCIDQNSTMCDLWSGFGQPALTGWGCSSNVPTNPACTWADITCDSCNNIIHILTIGFSVTGTISPSIGNLVTLTFLRFGSMGLTGSIPTTISTLTQLQVLDLDTNQLTGTIPSQVGDLTALNSLYLEANSLTGTIPNVFQNINLGVFLLFGNLLTGSVPASICSRASSMVEYSTSFNPNLIACSGIVPKIKTTPYYLF